MDLLAVCWQLSTAILIYAKAAVTSWNMQWLVDCTLLRWTKGALKLKFRLSFYFLPELGTRQFCRDNVTMLSGHTFFCNFHFTIFIVATPSGHWGLTIFSIFFWSLTGPYGYFNNFMLSRCRCHEAKKLSRAQLCFLHHTHINNRHR